MFQPACFSRRTSRGATERTKSAVKKVRSAQQSILAARLREEIPDLGRCLGQADALDGDALGEGG